jgi:hypothetical protein
VKRHCSDLGWTKRRSHRPSEGTVVNTHVAQSHDGTYKLSMLPEDRVGKSSRKRYYSRCTFSHTKSLHCTIPLLADQTIVSERVDMFVTRVGIGTNVV